MACNEIELFGEIKQDTLCTITAFLWSFIFLFITNKNLLPGSQHFPLVFSHHCSAAQVRQISLEYFPLWHIAHGGCIGTDREQEAPFTAWLSHTHTGHAWSLPHCYSSALGKKRHFRKKLLVKVALLNTSQRAFLAQADPFSI